MSLPIPSTNAYGAMDPKQLQAMDAPLIALTQQCGGDLRRLMFAYFSFLHRRTDFYLVPHPDETEATLGFREGDAEKLLLAAFRQFPLRRIPKGQGGGGGGGKKPYPPSAAPSKPAAAAAAAAAAPAKEVAAEKSAKSATNNSASSDSSATTDTASNATDEKTEPTKNTKNVSKEEPSGDDSSESSSTADGSSSSDEVKYTEEGMQIPVGNGGSTKRYKWTQTIEECSVLIGVPKTLRGKDLAVKITASTLSVKSKTALEGEEAPRTFLEGTLVEKVRADESTWSVEGGVVIVTLDKIKQTFWKTIMQGDEEIDTELVDNRRHIGEYDNDTQAKIRRIIFDQEQYHNGGPTSTEILGETSSAIPPLPKGVEYIDRKTLDEEDEKKKAAKQG